MILGGMMAIACFVSPSTSPIRWMVSGPPKGVMAVEQAVHSMPGAKVLDRSEDGPIAFVRIEFGPDVLYGDYMGLLSRERPREMVWSREPTPPRCPDGSAAGVGRSKARPVVVGILGSAEALAPVQAAINWAAPTAVVTDEGPSGLAFEPTESQSAAYQAFVARAAKGEWSGVEIVLLRPSEGAHCYDWAVVGHVRKQALIGALELDAVYFWDIGVDRVVAGRDVPRWMRVTAVAHTEIPSRTARSVLVMLKRWEGGSISAVGWISAPTEARLDLSLGGRLKSCSDKEP